MKRIVVIGAGESGIGAAILAKKLGHDVFVSDFGEISDNYRQELRDLEISFEEKGHTEEKILNADIVVKSPGVPNEVSIVKKIIDAGVNIISEIEWGSQNYTGKIIAITGSNGKTTTSGLMAWVMKNVGMDVALGGNYGKSFARILAESSPEFMVLEVSSFQLDDVDTFKPYISILLNITPDHLDRYHHNVEEYADAKFRITAQQKADDFFIYNSDSPIVAERMSKFNGTVKQVAVTEDKYKNGIKSKDGRDSFELSLKGRHNLLNAACVVEACRILGVNEMAIRRGLKSFVNLPHRLERCGEISGVEFVNDSKATNVDSVIYALDAMEKPVIWIAGGTDKGNDYSVLLPLIDEKVNALICLGADNEKLKTFFKPYIQAIAETDDMRKAVRMGFQFADQGDVVLLSPACASFDLFKNYIDRGDKFKAAVEELKGN